MAELYRPRRGQVWRVREDIADLVLVVSADDWNRRHVASLLAVPIEYGVGADVGPFATVIQINGREATIYEDEILAVRVDEFDQMEFLAGEDVIADVDDAFNRALSPMPSRRTGRRPRAHPYAGQIRFADLHIEGEGDKPVVVVSSESYAEAVDYRLVIVCRKTSNPANVHDYDVVLRSQGGKVVCSDVRTVPASDLRQRTTTAAAVSASEQPEVLRRVRRVLGLQE